MCTLFLSLSLSLSLSFSLSFSLGFLSSLLKNFFIEGSDYQWCLFFSNLPKEIARVVCGHPEEDGYCTRPGESMYVFFSFLLFFISFLNLFFPSLFIGFSKVVGIKSMRQKEQAWHVDTPLPHVYVNLLFLSSGQPMTQFLCHNEELLSFSDLKEEEQQKLLAQSFNPGGTPSVIAPMWREYIRRK